MPGQPDPTPAAADGAPEQARRIDIGGRSLALTCSGRGAVTVILETGLGAESAEWAEVQRAVAPVARVCRYDRANRGMSDPAPKPRSAADMADDLEALIRNAGLEAPFILVGHSFGGLLARLMARRLSGEVKGLVLVDSLHPDQFEIFGPSFPAPAPGDPPMLGEIRVFWTGGWRSPASTVEGIDFPASLAQDKGTGSLGDLPVRVLAAGTFINNPLVPAPYRAALQQGWDALQRGFLGLSTRATLIPAPGSGHFIQRDDPGLVARAIRALARDVEAHPRPVAARVTA